MSVEMKRWKIIVETSLFNTHEVEMSALTASIALKKVAYDYPNSNSSWFSDPVEIKEEPVEEEIEDRVFIFSVPSTSKFYAYVYANNKEEAEKEIAKGNYEDGSEEDIELDFSKAKFVDVQ